jgi:lipoxygenase
MLKPQLTQQSQYSTQTPFLQHFKPFIHGHGDGNASLPISRQSFHKMNKSVRVGFIPGNIKAVASSTEKATSVKAIVTVQFTVAGFLSNLGIARGLDDIRDLLCKRVLQLELVSTELDPSKYPFKKIIPQRTI